MVHGSAKAAGKKEAHGGAIEGRDEWVGGDRARSCPATDEPLVREADDGAESGERDRAKGHERLEPEWRRRVPGIADYRAIADACERMWKGARSQPAFVSSAT